MPIKTLSGHRRIIAAWVATALVLVGLAATLLLLARRSSSDAPPPGWDKAQPGLEWADRTAAEACDKRAQELAAFFAERGSPERTAAFAEEVLSWGGKWALVKDLVGAGDHRAFLAEAFRQHLFSPDELKAALTASVTGFLADLDQMENELLVKLRADLAEDALGRGRTAPFLHSDDAFRLAYQRVARELRPQLERDLKITLAREVGGLVAIEVATQLVLRLGASLAAELGVEAGILGTGAAAGAVTLGVGLVVAVVVDAILGELLRLAGHDPEATISAQVQASFKKVRGFLIDGNPQALKSHEKLRVMAETDRFESVRTASRTAAARIERGGQLGLRGQMHLLWKARAAARRAALRKLLKEGQTS